MSIVLKRGNIKYVFVFACIGIRELWKDKQGRRVVFYLWAWAPGRWRQVRIEGDLSLYFLKNCGKNTLNMRSNLLTKFSTVPNILAVYPFHSLGFELCTWITYSKMRYKILSERSSTQKSRPGCAVPDAGGTELCCPGCTHSLGRQCRAGRYVCHSGSQSQFENPYLFYFLSQPAYHRTVTPQGSGLLELPCLRALSACACSFQVPAEPWLFD